MHHSQTTTFHFKERTMNAFNRIPCRTNIMTVPLNPADLMDEERRQHHVRRMQEAREKEIQDSNVVCLADWEARRAAVDSSAAIRSSQDATLRAFAEAQFVKDSSLWARVKRMFR